MYTLLTRHSGQIGSKAKDKNARSARGKGNGQGWTFAQTSVDYSASTKHSDCLQTNNDTGKALVAGKDGNFLISSATTVIGMDTFRTIVQKLIKGVKEAREATT